MAGGYDFTTSISASSGAGGFGDISFTGGGRSSPFVWIAIAAVLVIALPILAGVYLKRHR